MRPNGTGRLLLAAALAFAHAGPLVPAAQEADGAVTGVVYLDEDGDGARDAGDPGLGGVVVSDQINTVATASDGTYRLEGRGATGLVFVSQPAGYRPASRFWRPVDATAGGARVDFGLRRAGAADDFTFVHASDTHLSPESLGQVEKLRAIVKSRQPAFVLVSGDLVRDALRVPEAEARGYYELYVRETGRFAATVWSVPGNHEIFGIERHLSLVSPAHPLYGKKMYRHYLGPTYYSFNHGRIHFVALDTVDMDDLWYYGHVDDAQLAWLERDLAHLAAETTVVTFNHIPFFSAGPTVSGYRDEGPVRTLITVGGRTSFRHTVSNAHDVLARLAKARHTLALAGHNHARETLEFGQRGRRVRFHIAAAVVGPGGPDAMRMTPGVTLYRVRHDDVDDGEFISLADGSQG